MGNGGGRRFDVTSMERTLVEYLDRVSLAGGMVPSCLTSQPEKILSENESNDIQVSLKHDAVIPSRQVF